jgi:acyl dehydratase
MSIFNFQPFLVSMPSFPVSPLGVVHIRTVLTQHKVLKAGTKLSYQIDMNGHRDTERGMEVDFVIKASLESGEVVWNCIETMLSRKKGTGGKKPVPAAGTSEPKFDGSVLFPVAENTGRRYAGVVGDYNPHHMNKIGAKLFGFPKPIAHGQWSLEHSLAQLQIAGIPARPPFKVDCHFKLPIFMPGKCLLRWKTTGAPKHGTVEFELRSEDGAKPHLAGKLENLDQPGTLE